jgi:hypothetical protein
VCRRNDDLADVLESAKPDLTNCGQNKVNGPLWRFAAWRRWRNGQDFKRRVRTLMGLCVAALEWSSSEVSSGIWYY